MAYYCNEPSHTFSEYLLIPTYSSENCVPSNVSLRTPLCKFKKGEQAPLSINIPLISACMQSVSNDGMAIALAREGGIAFIYCSQPIEKQAEMIARVKRYKAGFVANDSAISPEQTLQDILKLKEQTGHTTVAVTEDGSLRDYRVSRTALDTKVRDFMTPIDKVILANDGLSLSEANDLLWEHKLNALPVVDNEGHMVAFVFRKDYDMHKENPLELLDSQKRYMTGAGINTRDYEQRVPALINAGADVLCIDSSEGFTEWQRRTLQWIRKNYGDEVKVGGGNVVDAEGFRFLAEAGADFVKIGIGGGSICITREAKGIGRGQATSVIEVAKARDEYFKETGIYIPICSDGGIVMDYHITLALAMGADFCMLGRYFARFDESPTNRVMVNGNYVKEYWGEGSSRARNWQRYDSGDSAQTKLSFEEGVDSYVPYAGSLRDNVNETLSKIKSTFCNCGALNLEEMREKAKLTLVSPVTLMEGGAHDVIMKEAVRRSK